MTAGQSTLDVRPISPAEERIWDDFVAVSPQGTLFHTSAWQKTLEPFYGPGAYLLLGCFEENRLVGGCTVLARRRMGVPMAAMPLQTPSGGYLLAAQDGGSLSGRISRDSAVLSALAEDMGRRFALENLICSPGFTDPRPLARAGYAVSPRFTYLIDLRQSAEQLWERLDAPVRRQVRKAERLELEPCALDPDPTYAIFRQTFEKRGQPCPVSRSLFDAVVTGEPLEPFRQTLAVSHEGRLASFLIALRFGGTVSYALASTDAAAMATGASSLLIWQMLKTHASEAGGCQRFDFVGANIPSIARFKEGFGPSLATQWRLDRSSGLLGRVISEARRLRSRI